MIIDKMDPEVVAAYSPEFQKAFAAISALAPDAPLGKFEIDGDRIYGNVMEYDAVLPEAEKQFRKLNNKVFFITLYGTETVLSKQKKGLNQTQREVPSWKQ